MQHNKTEKTEEIVQVKRKIVKKWNSAIRVYMQVIEYDIPGRDAASQDTLYGAPEDMQICLERVRLTLPRASKRGFNLRAMVILCVCKSTFSARE